MSADLAALTPLSPGTYLGHPSTRTYLERFVQRRVPESEVPDLVQTVLLDALAASEKPREPGALRRWITAIARRRVVDWYRASRQRLELPLEQEPSGAPDDHESRALARWLLAQAPDSSDSHRALEWLRRAADGEKLEHIAATEALPPPLVRKRVSRLRQLLRSRWRAELAALALLGCVAIVLARSRGSSPPEEPPVIAREGLPLAPPAVQRALGGRYVLEQVELGSGLDPVRRRLVEAQVGRLRVRVEGRRLELSSPDLVLAGPIRVSAEGGGAFRAVAELAPGQRTSFRCVPDEDGLLRVESTTAPWQGELVLRREW